VHGNRNYLFLQNFQYPDDGFADVVLQLIYRFALRVAAREGWDLSPKAAFRIFMDDNGVILQASISHKRPARF